MNNKDIAINTIYLSIFGNAVLAMAKGITGLFGHSYALIADAIESTTDVFSSILVLFGLHYATKPADENHPYGHGKAEPLVTFLIVFFLLASATIIVYESITHIQTPHESPKKYTLIVLGIIIVVKELAYRLVAEKGKDTHSTALQAEAWHHRSDALTSLAVFIGISISIFMGEGYETADDWAALAAAVCIVYNAYLIFLPALSELMDEHLYDELIQDIRVVVENGTGVMGTEKCFVRKSGLFYHVDLHLLVDGSISVKEGHDIAHQAKDNIRAAFPAVLDVLIHVEPKEGNVKSRG